VDVCGLPRMVLRQTTTIFSTSPNLMFIIITTCQSVLINMGGKIWLSAQRGEFILQANKHRFTIVTT
jgi:hypothetical protein